MLKWSIIALALVLMSCGTRDYLADPPNRLSTYGLFEGDGVSQTPVDGVVPYSVNSELFTDYAVKRRFIKLPGQQPAVYDTDQTFEMPVGTIIAKTFFYPKDMTDLSLGERLLETRLLIHGKEGWGGLTYVWDFKQTDAFLEVAGYDIVATWVDRHGHVQVNDYQIPNLNQCKQCHSHEGRIVPIGVRARHLNRDHAYTDGTENQLTRWSRSGLLSGAPSAEAAPALADYNDPATGSIDERARAWLEINCAHCHSKGAPSWNMGLDLMASQADSSLIGVFKSPTAAGRGTGGHRYDVVPGKPEASILIYRIASMEPDVAMPELGRSMIHQEGVELVWKWIEGM
jgi:uncharacterized repeat protein (TIGR03806 family)